MAGYEETVRILSSFGRPAMGRELAACGVDKMTLSRLVAAGRIDRLARGVFHVPGPGDDQYLVWAAAALIYDCVVCCMSAAQYHGLTEASVGELNLAIRSRARRPHGNEFQTAPIFHRWSARRMENDVETVEIQGVEVRITSPARTIVDLYLGSKYNSDGGEFDYTPSEFFDCLAHYLDSGDRNARTKELRAVAVAYGVWDRINEIIGVADMSLSRGMSC